MSSGLGLSGLIHSAPVRGILQAIQPRLNPVNLVSDAVKPSVNTVQSLGQMLPHGFELASQRRKLVIGHQPPHRADAPLAAISRRRSGVKLAALALPAALARRLSAAGSGRRGASPVAIRPTWTAAATGSAGRHWPCGPFGMEPPLPIRLKTRAFQALRRLSVGRPLACAWPCRVWRLYSG